MSTCVDLTDTMDAKDLRSESTLGDRTNDGIAKYSHGNSVLQSNRSKAYQDNVSHPLGKVDVPTARPCAVIGPDRVVPPPAAAPDAYLKKAPLDPWPSPDEYRRPPEYPHKLNDYHHPARNISPRQTFQENMPRIMVPHNSYSSPKVREDHNFPVDTNLSPLRSNKLNVSSEPKYCDVPYTVNPLTNEQKNIRNADISMTNINLGITRNAPHGWSAGSANIRPSKPYGGTELYQFPEYQSCGGPRPMMLPQSHRAVQDDSAHVYPESYHHEANLRFKSYSVRERHPQTRYEYLTNYSNPAHPPPPFPSHRYEMQKSLPPHMHAYPGYSQVPIKYMDNRMAEPVINGYQRGANPPSNYNSVPYRNQMIHPSYAPVPSNCLQPNKYFPYQTDPSVRPIATNRPYDTNSKMYTDFDPAVYKAYTMPDNTYVNEMSRGHRLKAPIVNHNYPSVNMHGIPHPYYRKENPAMRNYDYSIHYPGINIAGNPSGVANSPSDSNAGNDTQTQAMLHEDYGYVSQSSSAIARSVDIGLNRISNDIHRRYEYRYGPIMKSPLLSKSDPKATKGKKDIDLRQFLQMWSEVEDENSENNKEKQSVSGNTKSTNNHYESKSHDELYVLGLVNVPSEELGKYEHIQKVSKLPENIKGYNNIELLNQFEEAIESSNLNNYTPKPSPSISREFHGSLKSSLPGIDIPARPLSPLDVEAKISQSIIHKDVGCNFEIKPCSPKMLNVEVAAPIHAVIGERVIEKLNNPLLTPPIRHSVDETIDNYETMKLDQRITLNENNKVPSCKMINTQYSNTDRADTVKTNYSLQDLESSSGICLASLPRLDNDIELNFQEVNQQFINANKSDSVITPVLKDLPTLDIEQTDISKERTEHNSIMKKLSCNTDCENEFSKLSKYRKLKRKSTDSIDVPNKRTGDINAQSLRTDSVIIKNPENNKAQDSLSQSTNFYVQDMHNPINLSMNSEERVKVHENLVNNQINEMKKNENELENRAEDEISTEDRNCTQEDKDKLDDQEIIFSESENKIMDPEKCLEQCNAKTDCQIETKQLQLENYMGKTKLTVESELNPYEINIEVCPQTSSNTQSHISEEDKDTITLTKSVEIDINEVSTKYENETLNAQEFENKYVVGKNMINDVNISSEILGAESKDSLITQKELNSLDKNCNLQVSSVVVNLEHDTSDTWLTSEKQNTRPHFYKKMFSPVIQNLLFYEFGIPSNKPAVHHDTTWTTDSFLTTTNENTEVKDDTIHPEDETVQLNEIENDVKMLPDNTCNYPKKMQLDSQIESLTTSTDAISEIEKTYEYSFKSPGTLTNSYSFTQIDSPTSKYVGDAFEESTRSDKDTKVNLNCEPTDTNTEMENPNNISNALGEVDTESTDSDSSTESDSDSSSDSSDDEEDSTLESQLTSEDINNSEFRSISDLPNETKVTDTDIALNTDNDGGTNSNEKNVTEITKDKAETCTKATVTNVESKPSEKSVEEMVAEMSTGVSSECNSESYIANSPRSLEIDHIDAQILPISSNECSIFNENAKSAEQNDCDTYFHNSIPNKPLEIESLNEKNNGEDALSNEVYLDSACEKDENFDYKPNNAEASELKFNEIDINTEKSTNTEVDSNAEAESIDLENSLVATLQSSVCEQQNDITINGDENVEINGTEVPNNFHWINRSKHLKKSLSDSALDVCSDEYHFNKSSLWSRKRRRVNEINGFTQNHLLTENYCNVLPQNRRNSISSVYNEDNVSFCILIDNDCIVDCDEAEKICIAEIPAECIDPCINTYEDNSEEVIPTQEDLFCEYTDECVEECIEENSYEESWVEDVACVETVVSEEIEEHSATASPKGSYKSDGESNDEEEDSFSVNDHADKVKYFYGDKMINDDTNLVETLYRTPQMNVNKTLVSREFQCTDRYYDKQALEEILSDKNTGTKINEMNDVSFNNSVNNGSEKFNILGTSEIDDNNLFDNKVDSKAYNMTNEEIPEQELLTPINTTVTETDSANTCELNVDNNLSDIHSDNKSIFSSSPEVSSTTSEEKSSSILLKITSFGGSRIAQVNTSRNSKSTCCKYTENKEYSYSDPTRPSRPLITKAAQKYIPPLKETVNDLKIKLHLPQDSLFKLKQLKISKDKPKVNIVASNNNNNNKPTNPNKKESISKKPKPKFEDVLKSIDEIQLKLRKENNIKKIKNVIPKVVIKKSINGSHYASTSRKDQYNPDLTGRKWQPWVFLEKDNFIDSMALKRKTKAIFNYRKNTYVLAEKFKKYKSVSNQFVISQPTSSDVSTGHLKYTIRLKHRY